MGVGCDLVFYVTWLFRIRGGFVYPFRWLAFGVGFGRSACAAVSFALVVGSRSVLVVLRAQRFRLSTLLVGVGFGRSARTAVSFV